VEITDYSAATNLRYADNFVYADQVVADLLGRTLTATVDGATATIATTTYHIDHLAYPDGVTPAKVLEDLIGFEQAFTYHLWESNPANDKFRFEWVAWPTTVRYEADVVDGFDSPASGNSVYNRVAVRYRNRGVTNVAFRTQTAPMLTAAGFDRTGWLDLGDEAASSANAARAGDQYLTEHQVPGERRPADGARPDPGHPDRADGAAVGDPPRQPDPRQRHRPVSELAEQRRPGRQHRLQDRRHVVLVGGRRGHPRPGLLRAVGGAGVGRPGPPATRPPPLRSIHAARPGRSDVHADHRGRHHTQRIPGV
jgi:hypothetical protein